MPNLDLKETYPFYKQATNDRVTTSKDNASTRNWICDVAKPRQRLSIGNMRLLIGSSTVQHNTAIKLLGEASNIGEMAQC